MSARKQTAIKRSLFKTRKRIFLLIFKKLIAALFPSKSCMLLIKMLYRQKNISLSQESKLFIRLCNMSFEQKSVRSHECG